MDNKILIAGESWISTTTHTKGFDSFTTSAYEEGVKWLHDALEEGGWQIDFLPNHLAATQFPTEADKLAQYRAVILSDIGTNTLLLAPETFGKSKPAPNRCDLIRDYVMNGGALCMIGGYLSFTGIDGKGRWGMTSVCDVLPVELMTTDDRMENPQGVIPRIIKQESPIFENIPIEWPAFLGYNRTIANASKGEVFATIGDDPFIAVGNFGKGKSAVFTSDCSPHWAPPDFCDWNYYGVFWRNLIKFITD